MDSTTSSISSSSRSSTTVARRYHHMKTTPTPVAIPIRTHEFQPSVDIAMLEQYDTQSTFTDSDDFLAESQQNHPHRLAPLRITFQRGWIIGCSLVLLGLIVLTMVTFANDGVRLATYLSTDKNDVEWKALLDNYNAVSGNLTSLASMPLDMFLGMIIPVGFLCFATEFTLRDHQSKARYLALGVSAGMGYLLTNGLHALNIQLVSGPIQVRIIAEDLARTNTYQAYQHVDVNGSLVTTWDKQYLEENVGNPVLNTLLRSNIRIIENIPASQCTSPPSTEAVYDIPLPTPVVSFPFYSPTWRESVLQTAIAPNGSVNFQFNTDEGSRPSDKDLPMDVSTAANLLLYGLLTVNRLLRWWPQEDFPLNSFFFSEAVKAKVDADIDPTGVLLVADIANLSTSIDEADSTRFMREAHQMLVKVFGEAGNISITDKHAFANFTRTDLSDTMQFEAMTINIPTSTSLLNNTHSSDDINFNDGEAYLDVSVQSSCSSNGCIMEYLEYDYNNEISIDPRAQALAICRNANGKEDLTVSYEYFPVQDLYGLTQVCEQVSNTSILVLSVGKHIEGDEWDEISFSKFERVVRLKNARMVYSITIGRLSWETEDLAVVYNAECAGNDTNSCHGLRHEILVANNSLARQLVVGKDSLPLDQLSTIVWDMDLMDNVQATMWTPLTSLTEGTGSSRTQELLLPRRFASVTSAGATLRSETDCYKYIEQYINYVEKNHLYMEESLQTAYTIAFHYLFQHGVVHEPISAENDTIEATTSLTNQSNASVLTFAGNMQPMYVQASIPMTNVLLTMLSCGILFSVSIGVILFGRRSEKRMQQQASAHIITEVMINDKKYPPFLLERVLNHQTGSNEQKKINIGGLCIHSVVLVNDKDEKVEFHIGC